MAPPDLPGAGDFPVHRVLPTRWSDNDAYGHLNNVSYYSLFDTAVNGWLIEAAGTDVRLLPAIGVVVETSCRFFRAVSFPDTLSIGIRLEHRGARSVVYELGVFALLPDGSSVEDQPRALGRFVHVYVDALRRTPVPIPDEIAAALAVLEH